MSGPFDATLVNDIECWVAEGRSHEAPSLTVIFRIGRSFVNLMASVHLLALNHEHFDSICHYQSRLNADRCDDDEV